MKFISFIPGSERPDLKGKFAGRKPLVKSSGGGISSQLRDGPGYSIMRKMGWNDLEPLGIRGGGVTDPVRTDGRINGDTRGLGYEEKGGNTLKPDSGDQKMAIIRIVNISDNYGVGNSDYGTVFIPNGAMNFIRHANFNWDLSDDEMKKLRIYALMLARPGKFTWRLLKVDMIVQ